MKDHPYESDLHRHLDGELPARESWEIEAHLRECADCAGEYDRIRTLVDRVAELPEAIEPAVDLWPGIAARLDERRTGQTAPEQSRSGSGDTGQAWSQRRDRVASTGDELAGHRSRRDMARRAVIVSWLGAVAAALLLGIGLGRFLPIGLPSVATDASARSSAEVVAANPEVLLASYEEPSYDLAIAELETILAGMRDRLEPETVAVVEENLAIIDAAIEEAREALLADPANAQLHHHLTANMQRKLRLLRTVTAAVSPNI